MSSALCSICGSNKFVDKHHYDCVVAELVPDDTPDRLTIAADINVLVDPYHAPMTIIDIEGERPTGEGKQ